MKVEWQKKFVKSLCVLLAAVMAGATMVGCKNNQKLSNEGTPLVLASDALDAVFNPFFYTAGADGEVVGQTQIGMLTSDENGALVAGWDQPTVAFDYSVVTTGAFDPSNPKDYSHFYTDYYFALKDNVKFSDGVDLTAADVLFNIYMYLDPAYTGSNTMYSVDIQGLSAYRTQSENQNEQDASDAYFDSKAEARIEAIIGWATNKTTGDWDELADGGWDAEEAEAGTVQKDILKAHDYFIDELNTDWVSAIDTEKDYEKYVDRNGQKLIKDSCDVFLYQYGVLKIMVDERNSDNSIKNYKSTNDYTGERTQEKVTQYVHTSYFGDYLEATKAYKDNLLSVITGSATADTLYTYILNDVIRKELQGEMKVKTVSGVEIMSEKQSSIPAAVDGDGVVTQTKTLKDADGNSKSYEVLHIRINGVDPKAIQNFSFTVAPGHHYSPIWSQVDIKSKTAPNFGVKFGDPDFMESVQKNHVLLGAGPYRATTENGSQPTQKLQKSDFWSDNIVYLERNDYFLLGAPKIRLLRFKVVPNNTLYDAVKLGEVHFVSPSMTAEKVNRDLEGGDKDKVHYAMADNLGYGYIGINARFINDINVRRAIMTTLNPQYCVDYYGGTEYASIIRRPMSKTLTDYYPTEAQPYYEYDETGVKALEYLDNANGGKGYTTGDDGFLYVNGKKLKYTFTIAGDSTDHPANAMLVKSVDILKKIGFDVTLKHSSKALADLAAGNLAVWAAAWGSSSDPDMYQVYHKSSKATSTRAWGYSYLTGAACDSYQRGLVDDLADLIEKGRESDQVAERRPTYIEALDKVMELAVEFPTYQRKTFYVWRQGIFDESTMFTGNQVKTYRSPLSEIWNVSFNEAN